jgi:hypothetical protein
MLRNELSRELPLRCTARVEFRDRICSQTIRPLVVFLAKKIKLKNHMAHLNILELLCPFEFGLAFEIHIRIMALVKIY